MMRSLYCAAAALCIAALSGHAASAANLTAPALPDHHAYITVAAMDAEVSVSAANLREKPTTHSKKLAKLARGTKVSVIEKVADGKWAHVNVDGKDGYIFASLLK
jgi:uncharacterized protein YgiM (DUF1202 family)